MAMGTCERGTGQDRRLTWPVRAWGGWRQGAAVWIEPWRKRGGSTPPAATNDAYERAPLRCSAAHGVGPQVVEVRERRGLALASDV